MSKSQDIDVAGHVRQGAQANGAAHRRMLYLELNQTFEKDADARPVDYGLTVHYQPVVELDGGLTAVSKR